MSDMMQLLTNGVLDLPWWGYVLYTLVMAQITIAAVTLYLHRSQAHCALQLHPLLAHFFRFWLWLTTGMSTRQWVAVHRKHHAKCETEEDPHSPRIYGIKKVFLQGAELYRDAAAEPEVLARYAHGTPNDWLEQYVYAGRLPNFGIYVLMAISLALFGPIGLTMWAVQMAWIPLHAAGGINGIGHYWGYRNYETPDDATNMWPWAFWIGGEELHNNHHAYPSSAKFSIKPWEFDIGWLYVRILETLGLAKVEKTAPQPTIDSNKQIVDMETLTAVIRSKMHVMADYANQVIKPVLKAECANADEQGHNVLKKAKRALILECSRIDARHAAWLKDALNISPKMKLVYQFRQQLLDIWNRTYSSQDKLLQALREWCTRAEQSGVESLQQFAMTLRGYSLQRV